MKVKAQKTSEQAGKTSVKIQDLIKFRKENAQNKKNGLIEDALFCHRKQNGTIKVSKWKLKTREQPFDFEKLPVQIELPYTDYISKEIEEDNDTKIWWLNLANKNILEQVDRMVIEHPVYRWLMAYAYNKNELDIKECALAGKWTDTLLFENLPRWIDSTKRQVIQKDVKDNVIMLPLKNTGKGKYSDQDITIMFSSMLVAFCSAAKETAACRKKTCIIHTACPGEIKTLHNNELLFFLEMITASFAGVNRLIFHTKDRTAFKNALEKYNSFNSASLHQFLIEQNYSWRDEIKAKGDGK